MKHNWEYKKIKEVCKKESSNLQQNKIAGLSGDYPVYGAGGIVKNVTFYEQEKPYVGIVKDGAGVGRANIYPAKTSLLGTLQYILPNPDIIIGYLLYCLQGLNLSKFASGATIPHIYFRDYGECLIPLPPLSVQERIVEELDRLSLILEKKKQQIKELDSLAQSIFYDMFGDPIENEKGWEVKKLGEICSDKQHIIRANKYFSKTAKIQYIDISSINNSSNTITNTTTFVFENAPSRAQQKVEYGDVLISLVRPNLKNIASIDIMCNNLVASSGFCVLRGINVSQYYIKALVLTNHFTKYLTERVSGANYPAIHEEDIRNCIIGIPPLDLQQSFAKKIEAIEKQKELINQSIKEVQLLFDAKMDYYFGD